MPQAEESFYQKPGFAQLVAGQLLPRPTHLTSLQFKSCSCSFILNKFYSHPTLDITIMEDEFESAMKVVDIF